jgi:hypothetical protein
VLRWPIPPAKSTWLRSFYTGFALREIDELRAAEKTTSTGNKLFDRLR